RLQDPALGGEYAYIMHMVRYAEAYNTHEAQAQALEGPIQKALTELERAHSNRISANAVRTFTTEQNLHAILKGTPNPKLRAFLMRGTGDLEKSELPV